MTFSVEELEALAVPDYDYGPDLDDPKVLAIRVKEGPFNGSVFRFNIAAFDHVEYGILLFVYEDRVIVPDENMICLFEENAVKPIAVAHLAEVASSL